MLATPAAWQDKIKIWFREPGWRPAGLDQTHPVERVSLEDFSKYDPAVSTPVKIYAFFQFFCTTLAGTGMLVVATAWPSTPVFLSTGLIFFSFYLQSAWTQERAFAKWLEWLKLGLVFLLSSYLPLSPPTVLALQAYLLISVLFLSWLTLNPARISINARRGLSSHKEKWPGNAMFNFPSMRIPGRQPLQWPSYS